MLKLDKFAEYIVAVVLLIVGITGSAIGLAEFFGYDVTILTSRNPLSLVLAIVGLLATALGLERVGRFRRHEQQMTRLESLLTEARGGQLLIGTDEIYRTATRLCSTTNKHIRTIIIGRSAKAPREWPIAVANRLREMRRLGTDMKFDAIIAVDFDNLPPDFIEGIDTRFSIYERNGVKDLVSLYLMDLRPTIGFDVVIFDRNHVNISFSQLAGVNRLQRALHFENQPEIASEFADWFDQIALRSAIPYEDWVRQRQKVT
jgi:hypothetical protein